MFVPNGIHTERKRLAPDLTWFPRTVFVTGGTRRMKSQQIWRAKTRKTPICIRNKSISMHVTLGANDLCNCVPMQC